MYPNETMLDQNQTKHLAIYFQLTPTKEWLSQICRANADIYPIIYKIPQTALTLLYKNITNAIFPALTSLICF